MKKPGVVTYVYLLRTWETDTEAILYYIPQESILKGKQEQFGVGEGGVQLNQYAE